MTPPIEISHWGAPSCQLDYSMQNDTKLKNGKFNESICRVS
jgi:hypothetical protein